MVVKLYVSQTSGNVMVSTACLGQFFNVSLLRGSHGRIYVWMVLGVLGLPQSSRAEKKQLEEL